MFLESVHGVELTVQEEFQKFYNDLNDTRTRNFTKPLENGVNSVLIFYTTILPLAPRRTLVSSAILT